MYSQQINQSILNEIKLKSKQSNSDAVIILKDQKVLYKDFFEKKEKPIYIASAGKSLVNLAIGKLLDNKQLDSIDQPIYTIYPEWKQGNKKNISIRMLLNHTSGIQNVPSASAELEPPPTYKSENIIKMALAAELSDTPGEKISYNNKAVALLGGIIEKVSGKPFDEFFIDEFYKKMDISNYDWIQDKVGNATTHGAFVIKPSDLLKFGQLILHKGVYNGKRIISESWINESLDKAHEENPIWGLLWWRLPEYEKRIIDKELISTWKKAGVDEDFIKKLSPVIGKLFENKYDYFNALKGIFGNQWFSIFNKNLPSTVKFDRRIYGEKIIAYYADGYRGNYLVIVPKYNIVAVRSADHKGFDRNTDTFNDFVKLVTELGQ